MLNEALRLIRVFHDMSQTQLSARLGISNSYLSEIESSKKQPSIEVLQKYADAFGMPVSSLLLFSEQLDSSKKLDRVRVAAAKKVVSILNWVAQKNGVEDQTHRRKAA